MQPGKNVPKVRRNVLSSYSVHKNDTEKETVCFSNRSKNFYRNGRRHFAEDNSNFQNYFHITRSF